MVGVDRIAACPRPGFQRGFTVRVEHESIAIYRKRNDVLDPGDGVISEIPD